MNALALFGFKLVIKYILKRDVFERCKAEVHAWAAKELSGTAKREGIVAMLQSEGIKAAEWALRSAIDLAYGEMTGFVNEPKKRTEAADESIT